MVEVHADLRDPIDGVAILTELLKLREKLHRNRHFGPYIVTFGCDLEQLFDSEYAITGPSRTLRRRIHEVGGVQIVQRDVTLPKRRVRLMHIEGDVS